MILNKTPYGRIKSFTITSIGITGWSGTSLPCDPMSIISVIPYTYNSSVGGNYPRSEILNQAGKGFEWYVNLSDSKIYTINRNYSNDPIAGATLYYWG